LTRRSRPSSLAEPQPRPLVGPRSRSTPSLPQLLLGRRALDGRRACRRRRTRTRRWRSRGRSNPWAVPSSLSLSLSLAVALLVVPLVVANLVSLLTSLDPRCPSPATLAPSGSSRTDEPLSALRIVRGALGSASSSLPLSLLHLAVRRACWPLLPLHAAPPPRTTTQRLERLERLGELVLLQRPRLVLGRTFIEQFLDSTSAREGPASVPRPLGLGLRLGLVLDLVLVDVQGELLFPSADRLAPD